MKVGEKWFPFGNDAIARIIEERRHDIIITIIDGDTIHFEFVSEDDDDFHGINNLTRDLFVMRYRKKY